MKSVPLPLFRQEALDYKRDTWLGEILIVRPTSFAWLAMFFLLLAIGSLAYLVFGEYTKKARVAGYLIPEQGLIKIFAQHAGTVTKLAAKEGQQVKKGDLLLVVSLEQKGAAGSAQVALAEQLQQRRQSLEDQKKKVDQIYSEQVRSATRRLDQLAKEQFQLEQNIAGQKERVGLAETVVARHQQLFDEKFISELALQEKRASLLDQQSRLSELSRTLLATERESVALRSELTNYPVKAQGDIASIDRSISEIAGTSIENEARREEFVLAPEDGMVTALQIDPGKQANLSQPVMSLIPVGSRLQADLYVPSRAVGFVRVGNAAKIQYQAFPYQKFGTHAGAVTKISRTALSPQELPFPAPAGDIYYVVTIQPERDHVVAYGKKEPLQTGMQVDADIWLDRRTLLEWIMEPLYSVSGRL